MWWFSTDKQDSMTINIKNTYIYCLTVYQRKNAWGPSLESLSVIAKEVWTSITEQLCFKVVARFSGLGLEWQKDERHGHMTVFLGF